MPLSKKDVDTERQASRLPTLGLPTPEARNRAVAELDPGTVALFAEKYRYSAASDFAGGELRRGNAVVIVTGRYSDGIAHKILRAIDQPTPAAEHTGLLDQSKIMSDSGDGRIQVASTSFSLIQRSYGLIALLLVNGDTIEETRAELHERILAAVADPDTGVDVSLLPAHQPEVNRTAPITLVIKVPERRGALAQLTHTIAGAEINIERLASWVTTDDEQGDEYCVLRFEVARDVQLGVAELEHIVSPMIRQLNGEIADLTLGRTDAPENLRLRNGQDGTHMFSFFGPDRVGMVADATGWIVALGGNIECCSQVRLQGFSVFIALATVDAAPSQAHLQGELTQASSKTEGIEARVFELPPPDHETSITPDDRSDAGILLNVFCNLEPAPGVLSSVLEVLHQTNVGVSRFSSKLTRPDNVRLVSRFEGVAPQQSWSQETRFIDDLEHALLQVGGSDAAIDIIPSTGDLARGSIPMRQAVAASSSSALADEFGLTDGRNQLDHPFDDAASNE